MNCTSCPYAPNCTFHLDAGGNWVCLREDLEGHEPVEYLTYTTTGTGPITGFVGDGTEGK